MLLAEKRERITVLEQSVSITSSQLAECRRLLDKFEDELASIKSSAMENEKEKAALQVQNQQLQEQLSYSQNTLLQTEAHAETIKLRAEMGREESLKFLEASTAELKCNLAAKIAECNIVETNLKRARQEIAEKEISFVVFILPKNESWLQLP
ncbi:hypothetical protein AX15_002192 [Amanita polypyramis BW_CC]|nr:hypothetical protein AX15_002192 [Amanita polypyramis BW_CC]